MKDLSFKSPLDSAVQCSYSPASRMAMSLHEARSAALSSTAARRDARMLLGLLKLAAAKAQAAKAVSDHRRFARRRPHSTAGGRLACPVGMSTGAAGFRGGLSRI